jgi:hypothetical protein
VVDWPETTTRYVTGVGVLPGNRTTVHHLIAFYGDASLSPALREADEADPGPGYACSGSPGGGMIVGGQGDGGGGGGGLGAGMLAAWAPGGAAADFPPDVGIPMTPGSVLVIQMHYNTVAWDGEPDQTAVELKLDDAVARSAESTFFTNPFWVTQGTMVIPAGDPDVSHSFSFDPSLIYTGGAGFTIYGSALHMHTRATRASLIVERNGGNECLLDIPRWDFNWQMSYRLAQPYDFHPGDKLRIECHWDNSPENQPVVNGMQLPPQDLGWGEGTDKEMCLGGLFIASLGD